VGIDEVAQSIQNGNVNLPTGTLFGRESGVHRPGHRTVEQGERLRATHRDVS